MQYLLLIFLLPGMSSTAALAQEVGIQFDSMKVGTKLTTAPAWKPEAMDVKEFVGEADGYFLVKHYTLLEDGSAKALKKVGYDRMGREVFSTRNGKTNTYTPYSCHFVLGKCEHTRKYFNSHTKKYVTNSATYLNRLEGDTLFVGVIKLDGSMYEVPFELGPHRLRLSSEYKNALGQPAGFKFVDLDIPD